MDDKSPHETPPPAARTATALRELHDRAQSALAAQRERMSRLEAQLTQQLDTIANTVAEQIAAQGGSDDPSQPTLQDIEQLRQEMETARTAWQAERELLTAQVAEQAQVLDRKQTELDAAAAQLAASRQDFDSRQHSLDDRAAELNHRERDLRQRQELLDAYAEQNATQQSQLSAIESTLDQQRNEIAEREAAIQSSQAELDDTRRDLEAREQSWHDGQAELTAQQESLGAEREAVEAERRSLEAQHASLDEQLQAQADAKQSHDNELVVELADTQKQLVDERATWDRERANVEEQRRLLAKERDELAAALDAARNELTTARAQAGAAAERDELQQKFELALHDVQRLRGRVAELEQELVSRPGPDQTDSVELVHLRAERDAMAERISELEQKSAAPEVGDADQERADLQRRFELAVEDVRDLKKKNSQLESQLAAASTDVAPATVVGGWEAMKKQMLANLEGEGDDVGEERAEQRVTIESTIRITDEALARKDQEIAELQSQLADSGPKVPDESEAVRQLVDADAVIAEHRARAAQLANEMQEMLRAAELEISVERAKIARETAHLEDLKAQIDAQRANGEMPTVPGAPGAVHPPKRRWLSKLGLGNDEET